MSLTRRRRPSLPGCTPPWSEDTHGIGLMDCINSCHVPDSHKPMVVWIPQPCLTIQALPANMDDDLVWWSMLVVCAQGSYNCLHQRLSLTSTVMGTSQGGYGTMFWARRWICNGLTLSCCMRRL